MTINDMAEMPVQLPRAPKNEAEGRGRYFNSGNAFNIKLPPVPPRILRDGTGQGDGQDRNRLGALRSLGRA